MIFSCMLSEQYKNTEDGNLLWKDAGLRMIYKQQSRDYLHVLRLSPDKDA